jgi:hypothetical protein
MMPKQMAPTLTVEANAMKSSFVNGRSRAAKPLEDCAGFTGPASSAGAVFPREWTAQSSRIGTRVVSAPTHWPGLFVKSWPVKFE